MGPETYPHLFSPFQLGRLTLPNRMMVPALTSNFALEDGSVGDALIGYLLERVRGGFGAVVTENIGVHPGGRVMARMVLGHDDSYLPGLTRLAQAAKAEGGVLIGQISHAGRQTRSTMTGHQVVAPSPIPCPLNREMPHELTIPEVEALEQAFIDTALRLAKAGFDGIELHGAHGYLINEFLSPYSNVRKDAYGGSLENRMRFLLRIIRGIKQHLGDDFPLLVRISAEEFVEGGLTADHSIEIAKRLEAEGVHALSVSVGVYGSFNKVSMITGEPEGQWLDLAGRIKATTDLPVIGVGRIKRASVAEAGLAAGQIDIAAFGRASIADPHLPLKVIEGREDDIAWCLSCNICLGRSSRPQIICPVNPLVGREVLTPVQDVTEARHIAVHGSGLAALTAAWAAAARGHKVCVVDDDGTPGGTQAWRARVPGQGEHGEVLQGARARAAAAGVAFTPTAPGSVTDHWRVRRFQPVNIQAHGPVDTVSCYDVLSGRTPLKNRHHVVAIGDDLATAEVALMAASRGARVTLVTPGKDIASDAHPGYREITRNQLLALGATLVQDNAVPGDGDLHVIGRDPSLSYDDPGAWVMPTEPADALISDGYEPGAFTTGVYDAFDLATGFDKTQLGHPGSDAPK